MRSRTEISESTVSCTSVSSTSTPSSLSVRLQRRSKAADPTRAKCRARSARPARTAPASCPRRPADGSRNPHPFRRAERCAPRRAPAACRSARRTCHTSPFHPYPQPKGGRRSGWPPVKAADETHPRVSLAQLFAQRGGKVLTSASHGCGSRRKTARRRPAAPSKTRPDKTTRR